MYKVHLQIVVKDKIEFQAKFECEQIRKDYIQSKLQSLTSLKINQFDVVYYDSQNDAIALSTEDEYTFARIQASNQNNSLRISAQTDAKIEWKNQHSSRVNLDIQRNLHRQCDRFNQLANGKDKKKHNKGNLKKMAQSFLVNPLSLEEKSINEIIMPNASRRQRKQLKKLLKNKDINESECLRVLRSASTKNEIINDKKQNQDENEFNNEGQYFQQMSNSQLQDQSSFTFQAHKKVLNYLASLKRSIKQEIIDQLPNYIKKQCFTVQPNKVNKIVKEPICFSCKKYLKELPLPIYVNNKNQFYCSDCEDCLANDDQLLVKIKSEALRNQIFMVKCVPIYRNDIKHFQSVHYSSEEQKYEEIVKFAKGIAISKINNVIFQEQKRTIIHNHLMRDQQRRRLSDHNRKRKYANQEHKRNQQKVNGGKYVKDFGFK